MSVITGKDGYVKLGPSETEVAYCDSWSMSLSRGTAEVSQFGKDYKEYVPTIKEASGSFSGTLDLLDPMQKLCYTQFMQGATPEAVELHLGFASDKEIVASAIITSCDFSVAHADKVGFSFNYQVTGEWSIDGVDIVAP